MTTAKQGDTVKVHYTGKLTDGTVFDSSQGREPLQFTIGAGQVIPGFEEAVTGMAPQENKTAEIPVDKAYGPRHEEMVMEVPREQVPQDIQPEVGQRLQVGMQSGQPIIVTITGVGETSITLDANPPLSGKDLVFDIELVEIV
ncbi:MAG: peptidylprolyl isomerase [Deltaproteobacteria bacterium]|jgi:peptidylprolyl isomerase